MKTTKSISTISFNTEAFLESRLIDLVKAKILTFWCFIKHKPEDDEGGKKEHFHLFIEPSKLLQTDDLREQLKELDPMNPSKPLGCLPFVSSKFGHWFMYAIHDRRYLASKGESRRFHYSQDEIVSSDPDNLIYLVRSIDNLSLSPYADMQEAIENGVEWSEYFRRGHIPIPQLNQFQKAWSLLVEANHLDRGDHLSHPMEAYSVDPETGEVKEFGQVIDSDTDLKDFFSKE